MLHLKFLLFLPGTGTDVGTLREDNQCFCFVIVYFQFIAGHQPFVILDAFLNNLYRFTYLMWWRRFPELSHRQMSAGEMSDARLS